MRCEEVRELLLSDYIDGELDAAAAALVKEHVGACASCAALEARVRGQAVAPFRAAREAAPPKRVWKAVERRITGPAARGGVFAGLGGALRGFFALPQLRPAIAAAAVALIAAFLIGYQRYDSERSIAMYIEEEA
jgi:anti-sigma factor RsiW